MNEDKHMQPLVRLSLTVSEDLLPRFCLLAGSGFTIRARTGCSVRDLLCGQLDIATDYLDKRIQTILLNNTVVDHPEIATVPAGSTIALSAAMPGMAGAMLRRGSPYADMRSQISHANRGSGRAAACQSHVVIKLFNMVQGELGPAMLGHGVQISGKALSDLFRSRSGAFRPGILTARIDDTRVHPHVPIEMDWTGQNIFLQINSYGSHLGLVTIKRRSPDEGRLTARLPEY